MPYHIGKSAQCPTSKPHAVVKDDDGKVMGCHATLKDAQKQMAALHAAMINEKIRGTKSR